MVGIINTSVTQQLSVSNPTQTQQTQNNRGNEEFNISEQESNTAEAQETQEVATSTQDVERAATQTEQDEGQFGTADLSALSSEDAERGSIIDISV